MSSATLVLGFPTAHSTWPDPAMGSDAKSVRARLRDAVARTPSIALGGRQLELSAACAEAADADWDGYGALPVRLATYEMAREVLEALPVSVPSPEIAVDPDGEVSFRWYREPRAVLSVSVSESGRLSYAALLGKEETHGTKQFVGTFPTEFATILAQLFSSGMATDRP